MLKRVCPFALAAMLFACGGGTLAPCTDREGRGETTFNHLKVSCNTVGTQLQCEAVADIEGLNVSCPKQEDVTQAAAWAVADSSVARLIAPGAFTALAAGHTVVSARWQNLSSADFAAVPIAVFPGTAPFATYELFGTVYAAGGTPPLNTIDGALVAVLDGVIAGQTAMSGVPPPLLPGYLGPFGGPGYYRLLGVPPGTYHLRVTKSGYAPLERTVTVTVGSPNADFSLEAK